MSQYIKGSTSCIYFLQGRYRKWAKSVGYDSKLPGDVKKRKAAAELNTRTLDCDLKEKKIAERIVPYSDKTFCRTVIEWLVATDQVRVYVLSGIILLSNRISYL